MLEILGMETRAIITQLEEQYPPLTPSPDDSIEKIMYRSGQRSVVEWLINRLENNG
jgi:hypothetical protein|tara:strand:+ start:149 stop:316 length:168 start_codon:yes stop_codon:yes gene_type:complete